MKYVFESDEIKTCNRCVFCGLDTDKWGEYIRSICIHPESKEILDVTNHLYKDTKPSRCPLRVLE